MSVVIWGASDEGEEAPDADVGDQLIDEELTEYNIQEAENRIGDKKPDSIIDTAIENTKQIKFLGVDMTFIAVKDGAITVKIGEDSSQSYSTASEFLAAMNSLLFQVFQKLLLGEVASTAFGAPIMFGVEPVSMSSVFLSRLAYTAGSSIVSFAWQFCSLQNIIVTMVLANYGVSKLENSKWTAIRLVSWPATSVWNYFKPESFKIAESAASQGADVALKVATHAWDWTSPARALVVANPLTFSGGLMLLTIIYRYSLFSKGAKESWSWLKRWRTDAKAARHLKERIPLLRIQGIMLAQQAPMTDTISRELYAGDLTRSSRTLNRVHGTLEFKSKTIS